jgi:hypothetical protein
MKKSKKLTVAGFAMATAIAGLFIAGKGMADDQKPQSAQICCKGANACKGKSGCMGADNKCKGENSCKGKGWMKMASDQCTKNGGKVVACPKM